MEIIFLIGLPGSGKSSWCRKFCHENPGYVVISTDAIIEDWAESSGKSYRDVWASSYNKAAETAASALAQALHKGQSIIVDRTNLIHDNPQYHDQYKLERQAILGLVPKDYQRIAIIFDEPADVIEKRRIERFATGKQIPAEVIETMRTTYQPPKEGEFDSVMTPNQFAAIRPQPASEIIGMRSRL
jgi:predicted kinase